MAKSLEKQVAGFIAGVVHTAEVLVALAPYKAEPAFASKPARDLKKKEPFELFMHLVANGKILLDEPIRLDSKGNLAFPAPDQRVLIRTSMAGVEFFQAAEKTNFKNGSIGAHKVANFRPTPAFAIVLYRLAKFLNEGTWGVTRIIWGGISYGSDTKGTNCHGTGHCVDFYGATTKKGAFDVLADWALKPVFKPDGKPRGPWGDLESHTYYRLHVTDSAYQFFLDVYGFAYEQCANGGVANLIGAPGPTIHPDYPDPGLRDSHQQHMHFQLGGAYE